MTVNWTADAALEHSTGKYTTHFDRQQDLWRVAKLSRFLVARWGQGRRQELCLYATDDGFLVEHLDDQVERSGGTGRRVTAFDSAEWALRYFAALHWELDDETVAATCAFDDPRCPHYRPPTTQRAQQP